MKNNNCIFCNKNNVQILSESKLAYSIRDKFPVTTGHSLIITKRHVESFFDLTNNEILEINELLKKIKEEILQEDKTVTGFNVGVNIGLSAGQSVFHVHVHLIPRRLGDIENPKGGVRGIIPNKRDY
ncbi:HIT family protein [Candidatus Dependentiae bacterium]|nr:HIT family protein [Candidatus Dependentiae bacterium]MBU4387413.1 HIT family protein [Candidatus Dependentiae bacterium]MCG2756768.1 HIT family protein [Candidatus Dependentiae bacterium]